MNYAPLVLVYSTNTMTREQYHVSRRLENNGDDLASLISWYCERGHKDTGVTPVAALYICAAAKLLNVRDHLTKNQA